MQQINFSSKIRKGPRQQRQCTDCSCALLLAILMSGLLLLSVNRGTSIQQSLLGVPMDSSGNICGENQTQGYNYLYFPESVSQSICVKYCPQRETGLSQCIINKQFKTCPKSQYTYKHMSKLCLPKQNPQLQSSIQNLINIQNQEQLAVLPRSFISIIGGTLIQTCAGILLAIFMLIIPTVALLTFYLIGILLTIALAVLFLYEQVNNKLPFLDIQVTQFPAVYVSISIIFVILSLFMIGYLLIRCFQLKNLNLYLSNSAVFFRRNFTGMLFSLFMIIMTVAFFYGWAMALVHLLLKPGSDLNTGFYPIESNQYWYYYLLILIPALLWGRGFFLSLSQFVISAQTIIWYCKKTTCCQSMCAALELTFRYHIGSIAFSGITVANWPARLLTWSRRKVKFLTDKNQQTGCCDYLSVCCCGFCYLLSSLSHFYHIQTILSTKSFKEASQNYLLFQDQCRTYYSRDLYKMGIFAVNAAKLCLITICITATYLLLAITQPYVLQGIQILGAIGLSILMAQAIGQILSHPILLAGQVLNICYSIDKYIEQRHYGNENAYSKPQGIDRQVQQ